MTAEHFVVYFLIFFLAMPTTTFASYLITGLIMDKKYKDMAYTCITLSASSLAFGIWIFIIGIANKIN